MSRQLATFMLGGAHYGVDVLVVQETLRYQRRTPVPLAPPGVAGLSLVKTPPSRSKRYTSGVGGVPELNLADGLHPNANGYLTMAAVAEAALKRTRR